MQVNDTGHNRRSDVVLGLSCLALELIVAPNITIANGHPNFMLVYAALVAMGRGGRTGVLAGFAAGLLFDLSATNPIGLMAFELTAASYALGLEVRNRFAEEPRASLLNFVVVDISVCALYNIAMLMLDASSSLVDCIFLRTLPTALLSLVAFLPFWWVMTRSTSSMSFKGKSGGPVLPGTRRSKHLDTRGL